MMVEDGMTRRYPMTINDEEPLRKPVYSCNLVQSNLFMDTEEAALSVCIKELSVL